MAHHRLSMTFGYFAVFSSSVRHFNSYLMAQKYFCYCNILGYKHHIRKRKWRHKDELSVAKGLKLPDLMLSLLLRWKRILEYSHNVMLYNSVTFEFWITLKFLRRYGNHKPKRFDFCIECQLIGFVNFITTDWTYFFFFFFFFFFLLLFFFVLWITSGPRVKFVDS